MSIELQAAQGLDTADLLDHIAWTDVIKPQLEKTKAAYSAQLTAAVLGKSTDLTPEQLAGIVFGINFIQLLFEQILRKGEKALKDLKSIEGIAL